MLNRDFVKYQVELAILLHKEYLQERRGSEIIFFEKGDHLKYPQ